MFRWFKFIYSVFLPCGKVLAFLYALAMVMFKEENGVAAISVEIKPKTRDIRPHLEYFPPALHFLLLFDATRSEG